MKIRKVTANNRKKAFVVLSSNGKWFHFPYSRCELVPSGSNGVIECYPDKELGNEGLEYILENGKKGSVLMDSVLDYNSDPEYVKKARLYQMTVQALDIVESKKVPKNEIVRRMGCTKTQLSRLLDTTFYGKSTDEMIRLLNALDCNVEIRVKKAS